MNMILFFLLCSTLHVFGAPTNQEIFLQANAAYHAHDYEKAGVLYAQISHKGPVTWYNMGNCAYHLKQYPQAYVYWKKSEQGASWALVHDAEHNIRLLLHDDVASSLYERIKNSMHTWVSWSSLWWLQILLLLIWSMFWFLYVSRVSHFLQGTVLLVICCCGIALKGKYADMAVRHGVVTNAHAPLYTGPNTQFHRIATLDEMAEIDIKQKQGDWYKVAYKNQVGWMPASVIASV